LCLPNTKNSRKINSFWGYKKFSFSIFFLLTKCDTKQQLFSGFMKWMQKNTHKIHGYKNPLCLHTFFLLIPFYELEFLFEFFSSLFSALFFQHTKNYTKSQTQWTFFSFWFSFSFYIIYYFFLFLMYFILFLYSCFPILFIKIFHLINFIQQLIYCRLHSTWTF
jgi:hypothetical protein